MSSVLVVDDEQKMLRILKLNLEKAGFEVVTACDGGEALDLLRTRRFDVLITDLNMPRIDGYELCKRIARELPDREPLTFVLTARPGASSGAWAEEMPNLEFLEKPVSLRKLLSRLKERLAAIAGEREAS